jgi:hypothetical protein
MILEAIILDTWIMKEARLRERSHMLRMASRKTEKLNTCPISRLLLRIINV